MSLGDTTQRVPPLDHRPGARIRTTSGTIAIANLNAQIEGERRLLKRQAPTAARYAALAELLAMRGQFLGRIADYEEALAIAAHATRTFADAPESYLARAKAQALFHRFKQAFTDLDRAAALGANRNRTDPIRASILQALGRYDEALALRRHFADVRPTIRNLQPLAALAAERGELQSAVQLFALATSSYRDVSPFPIAWGEFQQGVMWMRAGQLDRARAALAAAHARLPQYVAARGHLGEVEAARGNRDEAIRLLQAAAEQSDDPDYAAQLARVLADDGQSTEARRWRERAAARYEELIARFPEAFADHGAEFWLAAGNDPARALKLAQLNVAIRPTARANQLLLTAALAAHDVRVTCAAAAHARTFSHLLPDHAALTAEAASVCQHSVAGSIDRPS